MGAGRWLVSVKKAPVTAMLPVRSRRHSRGSGSRSGCISLCRRQVARRRRLPQAARWGKRRSTEFNTLVIPVVDLDQTCAKRGRTREVIITVDDGHGKK